MVQSLENSERVSASDVRRLCGDLLDWKVAAIAATGATLRDIETAAAWLEGRDDSIGETHHSLTGAAAAVYDLLVVADEAAGDEEAPRP
jgi:hypothetical protein